MPWVGLHSDKVWVWKKSLQSYGPGNVNFWKILSPLKGKLSPDRIIVVTSPGPFAASRATVSIANALGFAWDVPVIGVSIEDLRRHSPSRLIERASKKGVTRFSLAGRAAPSYARKPY